MHNEMALLCIKVQFLHIQSPVARNSASPLWRLFSGPNTPSSSLFRIPLVLAKQKFPVQVLAVEGFSDKFQLLPQHDSKPCCDPRDLLWSRSPFSPAGTKRRFGVDPYPLHSNFSCLCELEYLVPAQVGETAALSSFQPKLNGPLIRMGSAVTQSPAAAFCSVLPVWLVSG